MTAIFEAGDYSNMKMEKENCSEMSAIIHKIARCFITEDCHTGVQCHEILVFLTIKFAGLF